MTDVLSPTGRGIFRRRKLTYRMASGARQPFSRGASLSRVALDINTLGECPLVRLILIAAGFNFANEDCLWLYGQRPVLEVF